MKKHISETVGRKYQQVRFGLHSRIVGTENWYGQNSYKTLEEAQNALNSLGDRYVDAGGFIMDLGPELREYRIVKLVSEVEVLHTEFKKL
jgi:hypothetical protein